MKDIFSIFETEIQKIEQSIKSIHICEALHALPTNERSIFFDCYDKLDYIHNRIIRHCPPVKSDFNDIALIVNVSRGIIDKILLKSNDLPNQFKNELAEVSKTILESLKVIEGYAQPLIAVNDETHILDDVNKKVYIADTLLDNINNNFDIETYLLKRNIQVIDNAIHCLKDTLETQLKERSETLSDSDRMIINNTLEMIVKNILISRKLRPNEE